LANSKEFLGFNGIDCEAIIDLGRLQQTYEVVVNTLNLPSSWIWQPLKTEVFGSSDGKAWTSLDKTDDFRIAKGSPGKGKMMLSAKGTFVRYIKVIVTNRGTIPEGNPGAGSKAWLFVDEIEVIGFVDIKR
jgi:hexosaminidase